MNLQVAESLERLRSLSRLWLVLLGLACLVGPLRADPQIYLNTVKPVFKARCYACHGALKQKSGLRLDTAEAILHGGSDGRVVQPGDPAGSVLLERLLTEDPDDRMPPEGEPLSGEEIAAIRQWIEEGARLPEAEQGEEDPADHWAFQAVRRQGISLEGTRRHGFNVIDAYLEAEQQARNLKPVGEADRGLLLRRVYLDLIGLPPTAEERADFLADMRPDAYERVVERLLASPQYGERWGRHWMDIWRYTDWYGLGKQLRFSQKHLWHWRDWIVESLNSNKGYDQMIREMIAGDELAPTDPDVLRATGYLARNYYLFNRNTWLDQTIEHTSQAFLGLTMQCAKCHDHKYDPISQANYYQFRAIFEPHQIRLDPVPGETDLERDGLPRAFDAHPEAPTYLFVRGNDKEPDESRALPPGVPEVLQFLELNPRKRELPPEAHFPGLQAFVLRDHLKAAEALVDQAAAADQEAKSDAHRRATALRLRAAKLYPQAIRAAHNADRAKHGLVPGADREALVNAALAASHAHQLADAEAKVAEAKWARENAPKEDRKKAGKSVREATNHLGELKALWELGKVSYPSIRPALKALESPAETQEDRRKPFSTVTTGRRTALAEWMTDSRNPLTARVAVNHIWLRHFGQPLVGDVKDFGRRSPRPPLLPLLDELALLFMETGWRMKPLHRLMVTSAAYRRSSSSRDASTTNQENDPTNRYYWRRGSVRMESQLVRDTLRYLAGDLDLAIGGPTVDPNKGEDRGRRSLYFTHSRDDQHAFLTMFDDAEILGCYRRTESIIPQQALALVNSGFALDQADRIASRIRAQYPGLDGAGFVSVVFERVTGTEPNEEELALCLDMMQATLESLSELDSNEAEQRVRRNLVQVLFNHNDFITIR